MQLWGWEVFGNIGVFVFANRAKSEWYHMSFLLTALLTVKQPLKHYYYYYVLVRLWLKGTLLYSVVYRAPKGRDFFPELLWYIWYIYIYISLCLSVLGEAVALDMVSAQTRAAFVVVMSWIWLTVLWLLLLQQPHRIWTCGAIWHNVLLVIHHRSTEIQ